MKTCSPCCNALGGARHDSTALVTILIHNGRINTHSPVSRIAQSKLESIPALMRHRVRLTSIHSMPSTHQSFAALPVCAQTLFHASSRFCYLRRENNASAPCTEEKKTNIQNQKSYITRTGCIQIDKCGHQANVLVNAKTSAVLHMLSHYRLASIKTCMMRSVGSKVVGGCRGKRGISGEMSWRPNKKNTTEAY